MLRVAAARRRDRLERGRHVGQRERPARRPAAGDRPPRAAPRPTSRGPTSGRTRRSARSRRCPRPRARPRRSPTSPARSCACRAPGTVGPTGTRPRCARSGGSSVRRYSATIATFSVVLRVPRTASAVSAQRRIDRSAPDSGQGAWPASYRRSAAGRAVASPDDGVACAAARRLEPRRSSRARA